MALPSIVGATSSRIQPKKVTELLDKDFGTFPEWIGPRVLPKRGTLLFGGEAKTGKSWVMLEFARALALGDNPFADSIFTVAESCRVLMIEQELGEYGLQERSRKVFNSSNKELLAENLYYVSKEPSLLLDSPEGVKRIGDLVGDTQANVLIMDPISWMHGYEESSNSDIAKLFHTFEQIKKRFESQDLSIVISHHYTKPPDPRAEVDRLDPYNFRGAGKWKDAPDTLVTMLRKNGRHIPHETWDVETRWLTRHGPSPPDRTLTVNLHNDGRVLAKEKKSLGKVFDEAPPKEEIFNRKAFKL